MSNIVHGYVREDYHYSVADLRLKFNFDDDVKLFKSFIIDLIARKILVAVTQDDDNITFGIYNSEDVLSPVRKYRFEFVGIVLCRNRLVYSYPKYLGTSTCPLDYEPKREMKKILKVINKYRNSKTKKVTDDINLFNDEDIGGTDNNVLPVIFFLLEDYEQNGPYRKDDDSFVINGSGAIDWQRTMDSTSPILYDGVPYYVDLVTKSHMDLDNDYITRLYNYVITKCSYEVEHASLSDFFSLPCADLSDETFSSFGSIENILDMLDKELSNIFEDRKIRVVKALRAFFKSGKILVGETELQLIGVRKFETVWEGVCATVFKSQRDEKVTRISPRIDYISMNQDFAHTPPTLVELIRKPIWKKYVEASSEVAADKTFVPDHIRFELAEDNYEFYILDAKYRCPVWSDSKISKQPGVEEIAKQYMYYLAYAEVLERYNVRIVKNYFVMPARVGDPKVMGFAKLDILRRLGLGVVEVRMLDPDRLYSVYLANAHLDLSELD